MAFSPHDGSVGSGAQRTKKCRVIYTMNDPELRVNMYYTLCGLMGCGRCRDALPEK